MMNLLGCSKNYKLMDYMNYKKDKFDTYILKVRGKREIIGFDKKKIHLIS